MVGAFPAGPAEEAWLGGGQSPVRAALVTVEPAEEAWPGGGESPVRAALVIGHQAAENYMLAHIFLQHIFLHQAISNNHFVHVFIFCVFFLWFSLCILYKNNCTILVYFVQHYCITEWQLSDHLLEALEAQTNLIPIQRY